MVVPVPEPCGAASSLLFILVVDLLLLTQVEEDLLQRGHRHPVAADAQPLLLVLDVLLDLQ